MAENIKDLAKLIQLEDLDGETKDLAELIGIEPTLRLLQTYGGSRIYFRVLDQVLLPAKYRQVRDAYFKANKSVDEIRRETGYTETWIREILFGDGDPRQPSLFERMGTG